jgi:hypothetical protein
MDNFTFTIIYVMHIAILILEIFNCFQKLLLILLMRDKLLTNFGLAA